MLANHIWIRCAGCFHSAVILPAILAQLVGYDCKLTKLARRMKVSSAERNREGSERLSIGSAEEPPKRHPFDPRYSPIAPLALPDRAECNYSRPHETVEVILMGKELGPTVVSLGIVGGDGSGPLEWGFQ